MREENRRYIIGTNKSLLKKFEQELLKEDWNTIRDGIEVKLCSMPPEEGDADKPESSEIFILCRSRERKMKDQGIVQRAADKIAARLTTMTERCEKQNRDPLLVSREIGRLLGQNTRGGHLFDVKVVAKDNDPNKDFAKIEWKKIKPATDWHELSDGCYLLRTNVMDWTDEELWKAYMQLTEAEDAFRIQKSDLRIRPVWHQQEERVLAHILWCAFYRSSCGEPWASNAGGPGWEMSRGGCCRNSRRSAWLTSSCQPTLAKRFGRGVSLAPRNTKRSSSIALACGYPPE